MTYAEIIQSDKVRLANMNVSKVEEELKQLKTQRNEMIASALASELEARGIVAGRIVTGFKVRGRMMVGRYDGVAAGAASALPPRLATPKVWVQYKNGNEALIFLTGSQADGLMLVTGD